MTKHDENSLSVAQETAIIALVRGATVTEAAAEAGVSRQTVSAWSNHDSEFIAALNRARAERWDQIQDQLRSLTTKALLRIDDDLDGPNGADVALTLLKTLSRLNIAPTGSTSAEEIASNQALKDLMWS